MTHPSSNIQYGLSIALIVFIYLSFIVAAKVSFQFFQYNHPHNILFKSRNIPLNSVYLSTCLFTLYILIPLILVSSHLIAFHSFTTNIITEVVDLCIFFSFYMRTWVLWFDRIFVEHLQNWMWRREVNHKDSNVLIKHRQILKSSVLVMFLLYLFVFTPVYGTLQILHYMAANPTYPYIIRIALLVVLWLSTYGLIQNISPVFDKYYIRSELLQSIKTVGAVHVMSHVSYFVLLHSMGEPIAMFIKLFMFCISNLCILYSCYYCIKQHEFKHQYEHAHAIRNAATKMSFVSLMPKPMNFQQIMNCKQGFLAICNHLQNEISLESVLFLLEVTQFKGVIYAALNGATENNVLTLCDPASTSPRNAYGHHVPDIEAKIFNAETILHIAWLPMDPRMRSSKPFATALYLYDKYIEESADLCINISYGHRRSIYRFFQEFHLSQQHDSARDDIECLYELFDEAFRETWNLIATDSYFRFRTTDEFMQLYAFMHPKEAKEAKDDLIKIVTRTRLREKELKPIAGGKVQFKPMVAQETPESHTLASTTASSSVKHLLKIKLNSIMDTFTEIPSASIDSNGSKTVTMTGMIHSVDFATKSEYTTEDITCMTGNSTSRDMPILQYRLKSHLSSKKPPPLRKSISAPDLQTGCLNLLILREHQNRAKTTDDIDPTQRVLHDEFMMKYKQPNGFTAEDNV